MAEKEVYHYTSKEGLEKIKASGFIRESPGNDNDAAFGGGVYLTMMKPEEGRKKIAKNNWGYLWYNNEKQGKVERAIKFYVSKIVSTPPSPFPRGTFWKPDDVRDIVVHSGDLYLKDHRHEFINLTPGSGDDDSACAIQ